ncbi:MAG TPA: winged helix-turn-helix domain-containing protein [Acidimicrobiales bacterium]|nr:winged helix-turn-helix domain-containing protein [Acidimicrobiales bacterium]
MKGPPGRQVVVDNLGSPVAILQWPRDEARRRELAELGLPRLLVLSAGTAAPRLDDDEDWIRAPADERDVAARLAALRRRHDRVRLEGSLLHTARGTVGLSPREEAVAAVLLADAGQVVARPAIEAALGGRAGASTRTVDDTIYHLRRHLRPLGLDVFASPGRGFTVSARLDWPVDPTVELL